MDSQGRISEIQFDTIQGRKNDTIYDTNVCLNCGQVFYTKKGNDRFYICGSCGKLELLTTHFPRSTLYRIDQFILLGFVNNRSEYIRTALIKQVVEDSLKYSLLGIDFNKLEESYPPEEIREHYRNAKKRSDNDDN